MSSIVYKVPTKEISKLVLFVRCTELQVNHLIDSIFDYFCNLQNAQFCFVFFWNK